MKDKSLYIANVVGALGDLATYMLCAQDLDAGAEADRNYVNQDRDVDARGDGSVTSCGTEVGGAIPVADHDPSLAAVEREERWRKEHHAESLRHMRLECLRITVGNIDKAAAMWDFIMDHGPRPNLGLASNHDLVRELDARHKMGHTEPTYRSIDPEPEVARAKTGGTFTEAIRDYVKQ